MLYDFADRDQGIFHGTLIPPSFSRDGNIGIEQSGEHIGAYTKCCYADPTYDTMHGGWHCWKCKTKVQSWVNAHDGTVLDLSKSSSDTIRQFLSSWLNCPADFIEVSVTWD